MARRLPGVSGKISTQTVGLRSVDLNKKFTTPLNEGTNIETQQDLFYSVIISVSRTEFFLLFIFELIKVSKARSEEPITSCNQ